MENASPEPGRRWFRFRLRTFLIFVAVVAVWLGWIVNRARTQRTAVAAIQSVGGNISFDYEEIRPRTWSSAGKPRGPQWLRDALGPEYFDSPVKVGLFNTPKDRKWIDAVNRLPTVKTLLLSGRNVTDDTLDRLSGSSALLELHLSNSAISNDGLKQLAKFPRLQWLILNNTATTDAGMAHLSKLVKLQEVILRNTKVSDGSIAFLVALPDLQEIDLRGTLVTEAGAAKIREQVPKVRILR